MQTEVVDVVVAGVVVSLESRLVELDAVRTKIAGALQVLAGNGNGNGAALEAPAPVVESAPKSPAKAFELVCRRCAKRFEATSKVSRYCGDPCTARMARREAKAERKAAARKAAELVPARVAPEPAPKTPRKARAKATTKARARGRK